MKKKIFIKQLNNINEPKKHRSESWLVTFADMSLLLMTFFIIMLTFARIDIQKFKKMMIAIKQSLGNNIEYAVTDEVTPSPSMEYANSKEIKTGGDFTGKTLGRPDIIVKYSNEIETELMLEQMMITVASFAKRSNLTKEILIKKGKKGIRLKITSELLFAEGETRLKGEILPLFDTILGLLLDNNYFLIVEGYSDSSPISSNKYPSNWELSGARASSVIRYLTKKGLSSDRVTGIGYGSNYPLVKNDTPENRAKNRRVELIITSVSPKVMIK